MDGKRKCSVGNRRLKPVGLGHHELSATTQASAGAVPILGITISSPRIIKPGRRPVREIKQTHESLERAWLDVIGSH